jgi:putative peptidoglycan lipid II flippase
MKNTEETTLPKKIAKGTTYLTIMNIIDNIISFTFYFIISRILTTTEIGQMTLFLLIISIFNTLTLLSLNNPTIKYISENIGLKKPHTASEIFRKILKLLTTISLPALILTITISPTIAKTLNIDTTIIILALLTAFTLNYTNIIGAALFGLTLFQNVALQNIIFYITSRILAIPLATNYNTKGIAIAFLTGALTCLIYSITTIKGKLPKPKNNFPTKPILEYSLPLYAYNILALAQSWIDITILYALSTNLSIVGIYYIIVATSTTLSILWTPLTSTLFPTISLKHAETGEEGIKEIIQTATRMIFIIVMPPTLALAATAKTAITIAYGPQYTQATTALTILAATSIIPALASLYTTILQALAKTKTIMIAGTLSIITNTITLTTTIPTLSTIGAATARTTMNLTLLLTLYTKLKNKYKIKIPHKTITLSILTTLPLIIIEQTPITTTTKAITELITFTITTITTTKIIKPINQKDKTLLQTILPPKLKFITKIL